MSNAYIIYRGEKVPVSVESYFQGADGMIANVKALSGFPFYSQDVNSQGETSGAWNCNGYRVRTEFVMVEPVPAEAAYQQEHEEWLDEQATRESVRPF